MKLLLNKTDYIDTDQPIDLSIPLSNTDKNPKAWYVTPPVFEPVRTAHYTGSVAEGGSVNFRDIFFRYDKAKTNSAIKSSHHFLI